MLRLAFQVNLTLHPVKSLFDFARVSDVAPGDTRIVAFEVAPTDLALATQDGDLMIHPGDYMLAFENGAGEVLLQAVKLTGDPMLVEKFPEPA